LYWQVLMDPVCLLTCYPQLLHSFIYKSTTFRDAFGSFMGFANAVRIIFSRDLIIAEVQPFILPETCVVSEE
jgi:hypothetical protein